MALFLVVTISNGHASEYEWTGSEKEAQRIVEKLGRVGIDADYWEV